MSYRKTTLLSKNNHKTIKGEKLGYITYILYMSPYTDNSMGINLCPHASKGCSSACLFKSGFGGMYENVQNGRRNKTEWFLQNRDEFMMYLVREVEKLLKKHKGEDKVITFRLNGTTDIRWEKIRVGRHKNIFEMFPDVQFYDYTKNPVRFDGSMPSNYDLTFSKSEVNTLQAFEVLRKGYNVAMVFDNVPKEYNGYEVINGDETDLRFLDKKGVIVGLKYKNQTGKNADNTTAFKTGFAIKTK